MKKITYSKNVFIPLTTVCNNDCSYCQFKTDLSTAKILGLEQISSLLVKAKQAGCKEVLFTCGTQPNNVPGFKERLKQETGFDSSYQLLIEACKQALEIGLLPHSNPGVIKKSYLKKLAIYNASLGLMLETTAEVSAHRYSPTKAPNQRIEMIAAAGEIGIPFTSGLLIGIGEQVTDRKESLTILAKLHQKYGHLQEVIIQPIKASADKFVTSPSLATMQQTIKLAQDILPAEVAVQVPPNLTVIEKLLDFGVTDIGGISPVTDDYINPDYEWPDIERIQERIKPIILQERLPIYPTFLTEDWISDPVGDCLQSEGWIDEFSHTNN